ncbi:MAG: hypothetical protein U0636_07435 [Phycisphaerales bacterium]
MTRITLASFLFASAVVAALAGAQAAPPPPSAPSTVPQQATPPSTGGLAGQIVAARQANAAKLKQYQWDSRSEISMDGKQKDIRVEQLRYTPAGAIQRTVLNNQTSNMPIGFLRKAIAEGQLQQVEKFLHGLHDLLDKYTMASAPSMDQFIAGAAVGSATSPDGAALLKLVGTNVVQTGDSLTVWVNRATMAFQKVEVSTVYDGVPATMTATYKTSATGLTYLSMAEIDVPAKKVVLQVHNYDFEPVN